MQKAEGKEQRAEGEGFHTIFFLHPALSPKLLAPLLPFSFSPLLLLCISLLLSSCTFLYLPPILPEQTVEPTLDVSGSKGLSYDKDTLELSVFLHTIPTKGWLSVQWFSPNNNEAASDSIWIETRDEGLSQTFALPQVPSKGDWRVVVSFGDRLLRQFSLTVN